MKHDHNRRYHVTAGALLGSFMVLLLGIGTTLVAAGPPLEVTPRQKEQASREAAKGIQKVRDRDYRQALDHYLAALALDPYNPQARSGLAGLIGPIGDPAPVAAPAAAPQTAADPQGKRRATRMIHGTVGDPDEVFGVVPGAPTGPISRGGPLYAQARPYLGLVGASAKKHGVDARLILGVIKVESNFQPDARSGSGARGLMQLMPGTAQRYGAQSIDDPAQNIDAGTAYLRYLLGLFHGDIDRAVAAYNVGEMTVVKQGGVPGHEPVLRFVRDVKGYAARF